MKNNNPISYIKYILTLFVISTLISSCDSSSQGNLTGVEGRQIWYQADPYGMLYIPMGSFVMGPSDQDAPYSHTTKAKTVSVQAFYMDQTEITNNEYRQFVFWVRDSIMHQILGNSGYEDHLITEDYYGEPLEIPRINWDEDIDLEDPEVMQVLEPELYFASHERFKNRREIDPDYLQYSYSWIDYKDAARKSPTNKGDKLRQRGIEDRSVFIKTDIIPIYPDTLCWIHDFTYSYNEPMTKMYFSHPAYDEYPVVGVSWKQARAFSIWRTDLMNSYLSSVGSSWVHDFRLPTESEWEYAARGGLDQSPYPWGGPYIRNLQGCFLGNFKPLRGNYIDDGGFHTVKATSYSANDYGLYCMAGNVSEWTSNAFDESSYDISHDLNMDYVYEAKDDDLPVLKRKVIRGGSWKDVGYFMQTSSRAYEYQDTGKCYIGFRNVQTYLGRSKGDDL